MKPRGFGCTDVGVVRESNEDCLLAADDLGLYVVCDGMGGHAAGEVASRIATETVAKAVRSGIAQTRNAKDRAPDHAELQIVLRQAIETASSVVCEEATRNPERSGMGCTITLLLFAGQKALMAHVGDTRLYLLRDGAVELLSSDHTVAADMVRRGDLTPTAAREHRYSNALTRCVGSQDAVQVDSLVLDVHPDDRFLLCSDGLSGYVESLSELAAIMSSAKPAEVPAALIGVANDRGGKDNITAILVVMEATDDELERLLAVSDESRRDLEALRGLELCAPTGFADALRILSHCEIRSCRAGEVVVGIDQRQDRLCFVLAGRCELRSSGESAPVEMSTGDYVGETALLVPQKRRSELSAIEDSRVLILTGDRLSDLARRRPWLGVALMTSLAAKLSRELDAASDVIRETVARGRSRRRGMWSSFIALFR